MSLQFNHRRSAVLLGWVLAVALLNPASAPAQAPTPSLASFLLQSDYLVVVDGAEDERGEVFFSQSARAYLVITPALTSPVLMWPRTGNLEKVNLMKVDRQGNGTINLLPGAGTGAIGKFEATQATIQFAVDGHQIELKTRPPLLGQQDLAGMKAYSAEYIRTAEAYSPSKPILDQLRRQQRDVRVQIFFGTWCPHCKQMVPRMMRVDEALVGSKIKIEYYGLPQGDAFTKDPEIQGKNITGVPTGIVYVDGKEVGRIGGNAWKVPELAIKDLIG